MRAFFIGTVDFSKNLLLTTLELGEVEIVGIGTKSKSTFNTDHSDLSDLAIANGIPYKYINDINAPHITEWIASLKPDVIFCFGWSSLIKAPLLKLARKGVIGYHPAKLPKNRGRHPVIWALALGLDKTASTFFKMDEGADSGDIVSQKDVNIEPSDNAQTLYNKLIATAQQQSKEWIPLMAQNKLNLTPQDNSNTNYWRKRGKKDGEIDFRMSTQTIYNLTRALTKPYVGAHVIFQSKEFKVWSCEIGPNFAPNLEPGKVLEVSEKGILVKTADSSIYLLNHEIDVTINEGDYFE
ncbi:MAG: formyl transferase [Candidatus Brocadia sp. WS118]|nr:MAG: formyl transferase [Candidatus Brocadia sp. WS118]